MALLKAQGKLSWAASTATDVVGYNVYQAVGASPAYDSPNVSVGNVFEVTLPLPGLPAADGEFRFAVASVDRVGNISDLRELTDVVVIDTTPPDAPATVTFSRDF